MINHLVKDLPGNSNLKNFLKTELKFDKDGLDGFSKNLNEILESNQVVKTFQFEAQLARLKDDEKGIISFLLTLRVLTIGKFSSRHLNKTESKSNGDKYDQFFEQFDSALSNNDNNSAVNTTKNIIHNAIADFPNDKSLAKRLIEKFLLKPNYEGLPPKTKQSLQNAKFSNLDNEEKAIIAELASMANLSVNSFISAEKPSSCSCIIL